MQYRTMKKTGDRLSVLGYGCMRLPVNEDGSVNRKEAIAEIRYAIDHGVNYFDTAYVYHFGESETVLAEALENGYREKVKIASKLPSFFITSREQMDRILEEQLQRLRTDHIDYYLIHNLNGERWQKMVEMGIKDFMDKAIAAGKIKHAGFSFHGSGNSFSEIVDGYDWTFCQIQFNYLDENVQAGVEGLKYAAEKGLGIIVMEPLRGGILAKPIPAAEALWKTAKVNRSPVEWGLRWVWDHPEVDVVLSGMSNMDQVVEKIRYAENGLPKALTQEEHALIREVKAAYDSRIKISCTGCGYCLPCSSGIDIPECFYRLNNSSMFENLAQEKESYERMKRLNILVDAAKCIECGLCEEKCPQHIPIMEKIHEFVEIFD